MSQGKLTDSQARRQAMILAAQLPTNPVDAKVILTYMQHLVRFVADEREEQESESQSS